MMRTSWRTSPGGSRSARRLDSGPMTDDGARANRREALLEQLRAAGGKALSVRDLMQRARLHPGERSEVKRALRDLVREGELLRDGKRFSLLGAKPVADSPAPRTVSGKRLPLGRRRGIEIGRAHV